MNTDAASGQNDANGIFLRFPTPTAQNRKVSNKITVAGGSSRSRRRSNGAPNLVMVASKKELWSAARTSSEGTTLGTVAKWMLSGLGSTPMKPSHSSVTTKVTMISMLIVSFVF